MKRWCCLAALMLVSPSAYAGGRISFSVGGHRIHIESSSYCRSISCASASISGVSDWRRTRDDDAGDRATQAPVPAATMSSLVGAPATAPRPPAPPVAAPPGPPPMLPVAIVAPPPPPAPAVIPVERARPIPVIVPQTPVPQVTVPQISRVAHEAEDDVADSPLGDWQTEGKGVVRIDKCGRALCGYVLNSSSDDKGEAVLVNMKPKTDIRWSGNVYSHDSGDSYYGTIEMKSANTLRVEACALGRFYCSGNNWSRIRARAERLVTSRQTTSEPRS
jgi:uncharacterized protein (DUF2147 family)